jgi:hypothetical protein
VSNPGRKIKGLKLPLSSHFPDLHRFEAMDIRKIATTRARTRDAIKRLINYMNGLLLLRRLLQLGRIRLAPVLPGIVTG